MKYFYQSGEKLRNDITTTQVPYGCVAVWSLGQAGFVLKGAGSGHYIVLDPYLTRSIETGDPETEFIREFHPPLQPEDLTGAAAVLISHEHSDHLDIETIIPLHRASPETKFILPAPHKHLVLDTSHSIVFGVKNGDELQVENFSIEALSAAHTEYRVDDEGQDFYLGYLITVDGIRIYFSGDTVVTPQLIQEVRSFSPHVAMLPINGGDVFRTSRNVVGNMSGREAVDFCSAVGADLFVPFHYDMFPNNRDNPAHTVDYLFHYHRNQKFHMMTVGERFIYMP